MVRFFKNQDEQGVERGSSVVKPVIQGAKKTAKSVAAQLDMTKAIVDQLYGESEAQEGGLGQNEDQGVEAMAGQSQGKTKAALKAMTNARNPALQQAAAQRHQALLKTKSPEKVEELERLRKMLHEEQTRDIFHPTQEPEENIAEKQAREEEEKKQKKEVKKYEEVKKKQDLAVVQKRTSVENKGWGAG